MPVGSCTSSREIPPNVPVIDPASVKKPEAYPTDDLDGICTVRVTQDYAGSRAEYMDVIRSLYSRGKGRLLLNEVARIGWDHGVFPVLGLVTTPQDHAAGQSLIAGDHVLQAQSVVRVNNGLCFWDPLSLPVNHERYHEQLDISLAELCWRLGSTIPGYSPDFDLQNLIAPRGERASSVSTGLAPESGGLVYRLKGGVLYTDQLPTWEGRLSTNSGKDLLEFYYDLPLEPGTEEYSTLGLLEAYKDVNLSPEVRNVLEEIGKTKTGSALLRKLNQCLAEAKRRGKHMIVAQGNKQSGLTRTTDGSLVWLFDESDLIRRYMQAGLFPREWPIYSAFVDLCMVRDHFVTELGLRPPRLSFSEMTMRFHKERSSESYYHFEFGDEEGKWKEIGGKTLRRSWSQSYQKFDDFDPQAKPRSFVYELYPPTPKEDDPPRATSLRGRLRQGVQRLAADFKGFLGLRP